VNQTVAPGGPLRGELAVPGDKSISHRALLFGALAKGTTGITGLGPGGDVKSTMACLKAMGADIEVHLVRKQTLVAVKGKGMRAFAQPSAALDCGNSGTSMRLLMGILSGQDFSAKLTGDASLKRRPMARVADPLTKMGAAIKLSKGGKAPVTVKGGALRGIEFVSPVASAQLKSAVLLAGLFADGATTVTEPARSRDHTEWMLRHFRLPVSRRALTVSTEGVKGFAAQPVRVPGDASSAAFWVVAATLVPGSELTIPELNANPTRTAYLSLLERMGAQLERKPWEEGIIGATEPVMDLVVRSSSLKACDVSEDEVPGLIDEIPILALAATQAEGTSRFRGLAELRVKESDRLSAIAKILTQLGAEAKVEGDDLVVSGPAPLKGRALDSLHDHRLAMTGAIAGLLAKGQTTIKHAECADISYPGFFDELKSVRS
jgi:3-phosphoshikimate 1-carboxyvinyltransferase